MPKSTRKSSYRKNNRDLDPTSTLIKVGSSHFWSELQFFWPLGSLAKIESTQPKYLANYRFLHTYTLHITNSNSKPVENCPQGIMLQLNTTSRQGIHLVYAERATCSFSKSVRYLIEDKICYYLVIGQPNITLTRFNFAFILNKLDPIL